MILNLDVNMRENLIVRGVNKLVYLPLVYLKSISWDSIELLTIQEYLDYKR